VTNVNENETGANAMRANDHHPIRLPRRLGGLLQLALASVAAAAALVAAPARAQTDTVGAADGLTITVPNGYARIDVDDMNVLGSVGGVRWSRVWNGQEWQLNPQWESLSQSWKNLTGSQTADTTSGTIASSGGGGGGSGGSGSQTLAAGGSDSDGGCWVMVDEDWQPTVGKVMIGGVYDRGQIDGARMEPFNRIIGDTGGGASQDPSYVPPMWVNIDWAGLCMGTMATSTVQTLDGVRRNNELYLGDGTRYSFNNREVLEKRAVTQLAPAADDATLVATLATGSYPVATVQNPKGYRWSDRGGSWIEYNTQGQVVGFGDANNNRVYLARSSSGTLMGVVGDNGHVIYSLHYSGSMVDEVHDYPIAGDAADKLPARVVKYQYDDRNRLWKVTDVRGHVTTYDYDVSNRVTQITDADGRVDKIAYDGNDFVSKRIAPDGAETDYVFEYDSVNKQFNSHITYPPTAGGQRVDVATHNRVGQLVRQQSNGITTAEVHYDTGARIQSMTNSRGFTTRLTRNEFDQVVEEAFPDGATVKRTYTALNLQLTDETDELGTLHHYEYDALGNLLKAVDGVGTPDERTTEYVNESHGWPKQITYKGRMEANGTVTPDAVYLVEYDAVGSISKVTDPEGYVWRYGYDRDGNLTTATNPLGKTWTFGYDPADNQETMSTPLGRSALNKFDNVGDMLSMRNARGKTWQRGVDAMGRETGLSDPYGATYSRTFDGNGALVEASDASGKKLKMEYDALVRVVQSTDGNGASYRYDYTDADGTEKGARKPTKLDYPTFQRQMRYDERDRLTIKNDIDGQESRVDSYAYNGAALRKTATDANGKTRYYDYTPHGEIAQIKDPLGNALRQVYDARGNVIEIVDPNGHKTEMIYDRRDLLKSSKDALGHVTAYDYDERGHLKTLRQANGQRVEYQYDDDGQLAHWLEYAADDTLSRKIDFTFDEVGNLTNWSDGTLSADSVYDDADRLLSETVHYGGGVALSRSYTYYANNQIQSYTGPDGVTITYAYDPTGQLQQVSIPGEGSIAVTEWRWNLPKTVLLPGGTSQQLDYDGYQNLSHLRVLNPAQAVVFELQNQFGHLSEVKQTTTDATTVGYGYDDAERLTSVSAPSSSGRAASFTVDALSNRTTDSRTGSSVWHYDDANQLSDRGSVSYVYDDAGNQIRKVDSSLAEPARTTRYEYDALNRLSKVYDGGGTLVASYTYGPFDLRLSKTVGGRVTYFLHGEHGVLAEADASGTVSTLYGWNPQVEEATAPLFARVPDTSPSAVDGKRYVYFHDDELGTPLRATDKSGAVVWSADYDSFGRATVRTTGTNPVTINLRLAGQYFDAETGLHYNDRRYYDTDTGRYVTRDPIGFEGGINLYGYAGHSPTNFIDPTGEFIPIACIAINYGRCMIGCMAMAGVQHAVESHFGMSCGDFDWKGNLKDCALDCLLGMLPLPNPCGKFGKMFGTAVGLVGGLLNSFTGDTLVQVRPAGAAPTDALAGKAVLKPISEIRIGDQVLAFSEGKDKGDVPGLDGRLSYQPVVDLISSERSQRLVHITLDSGERITATEGHPFLTTEGWRDAILLKKGGKLKLNDSHEIVAIDVETKVARVFNLEVAHAHTYLVGEAGIVVHNGVTQNRTAGGNFEQQVANTMRNAGSNVRKSTTGIMTPHGMRFPDLEVLDQAGNVTRFIECKKGKSRYHESQRKKDQWIHQNMGIGTTVVRG